MLQILCTSSFYYECDIVYYFAISPVDICDSFRILFLIMKFLTVVVIIFDMEVYELFEIPLQTKTLNANND